MLAPWKESYGKPRECIKKQRHHFANKGPYGQSYGFSGSLVGLWELDHKEGQALKNWCFLNCGAEKTLEGSSTCKDIKPVNPKGNWPWIFIRETVLKLELQYFGHLMWRADSLEKTLMLGKIEGRRKWGRQGMKWLDSIISCMDMNLSELWEMVEDSGAGCATVHGVIKRWTGLSDWTTTT